MQQSRSPALRIPRSRVAPVESESFRVGDQAITGSRSGRGGGVRQHAIRCRLAAASVEKEKPELAAESPRLPRFFARTLYRPRVQTDAAGHGARESGNRFEVALQNAKATLVSFGAPGHGIAALRRRRLVADSPRILARDDRAAHLAGEVEPPR